MRNTLRLSPLRILLTATLLLGAAAAQAAGGYIVTATQEKMITVGMTRSEVMTALGRPAHNLKYRAEPGRTWTYGVRGGPDTGAGEEKVFDVDFGADGKVMSTGERTETFSN